MTTELKIDAAVEAAYEAANREYTLVSRDHNLNTIFYRERKIGDAEFLASRARLNSALASWERANDAYTLALEAAGEAADRSAADAADSQQENLF